MFFSDQVSLFSWAESALGGRIIQSTRPNRKFNVTYRSDWFFKANISGATSWYYLRRAREYDDDCAFLQREANLLVLLRNEGIPVPRVLAQSCDHQALLLEFVEGSDDPSQITDPDVHMQVSRSFIETLSKFHALTPTKFQNLGLVAPGSKNDYIIPHIQSQEEACLPLLHDPTPLFSFMHKWLLNNIPEPPEHPSLIHGDLGSGQFIFSANEVSAIIDWEAASIGDPMHDLALVKIRDAMYPGSNISDSFNYYEHVSGAPIDHFKINYYCACALYIRALGLETRIQNPDRRVNQSDLLSLSTLFKRLAIESIAQAIDIKNGATPISSHRSAAQSGARASENAERTHMETQAFEMNELGQILGKSVKHRLQALALLDELVAASSPDDDCELLCYFYKKVLGEESILKSNSNLQNS